MLLGIFNGLLQQSCKAAAVEDVVTQNETGTVVTNELFTDDEGLGETVRRGLFSIFETYAQILTTT